MYVFVHVLILSQLINQLSETCSLLLKYSGTINGSDIDSYEFHSKALPCFLAFAAICFASAALSFFSFLSFFLFATASFFNASLCFLSSFTTSFGNGALDDFSPAFVRAIPNPQSPPLTRKGVRSKTTCKYNCRTLKNSQRAHPKTTCKCNCRALKSSGRSIPNYV